MSGQGSVFLPNSGSNGLTNMLSATSTANWTNGKKNNKEVVVDSQSKKLMGEINDLLSEIRKGAEVSDTNAQLGGGSKKKSVSKSKKSSSSKKAKSKSKSKSKSKKASVPKKVSVKKTKSKSKSKSKSRKMKREEGEKPKREMNNALKEIRELAVVIKTEITELKDGIPMTSTASKLIKKHGGLAEAKAAVKKNPKAIIDLYNNVVEEQRAKREAKKAAKNA
jgi:hypothetical protein